MKLNTKTFGMKHAVCGAVVLLSFAAGSAAADEAESPRYTVSAIRDAAYGQKVMSNRIDVAIEKLEKTSSKGIHGFYVATNLCVAYLKSGAYDNAEKTCDLAVARISKELESEEALHGSRAAERSYRRFLSVALSNRGVARAVNGDTKLAREDFEAALAIRSNAREPQINLSRLAQVATPAA